MVSKKERYTAVLIIMFLNAGFLASCTKHQFFARVSSGGDKGNHFVKRPIGLIERVHKGSLLLPPTLRKKLQLLLQQKLHKDKRLARLWQAGQKVQFEYKIRLLKTPGTRAGHALAGTFLILVEVANVGLAVGLTAGTVGAGAPAAIEMVQRLGLVIARLFSGIHGVRVVRMQGRIVRRNRRVVLHNQNLQAPKLSHLDPGDVVGFYKVEQTQKIYGPFVSSLGFFDLWIDEGALYQGYLKHLADRAKISIRSLAGRFMESASDLLPFPQKASIHNGWGSKQSIQQGQEVAISSASNKQINHSEKSTIKIANATFYPIELDKQSEQKSAKPGELVTYRMVLRKTFIKRVSELVILDVLPRGMSFVRWLCLPDGVSARRTTRSDGTHMLRLHTRRFGGAQRSLVFRYQAKVQNPLARTKL